MLDLEVSSLTPTITAAMHAKAWRNGLYLFWCCRSQAVCGRCQED
jgi:hypothetical protein